MTKLYLITNSYEELDNYINYEMTVPNNPPGSDKVFLKIPSYTFSDDEKTPEILNILGVSKLQKKIMVAALPLCGPLRKSLQSTQLGPLCRSTKTIPTVSDSVMA